MKKVGKLHLSLLMFTTRMLLRSVNSQTSNLFLSAAPKRKPCPANQASPGTLFPASESKQIALRATESKIRTFYQPRLQNPSGISGALSPSRIQFFSNRLPNGSYLQIHAQSFIKSSTNTISNFASEIYSSSPGHSKTLSTV